MRPSKLKILGEGALIFHASGLLPISSELTLKRDIYYPFGRNILLILGFYCLPYIICLLLSNSLYRYTDTKAPTLSCAFSLIMFIGTLFLWQIGNHSGEKGMIVIPLMALQNFVGMVSFGALRHYYQKQV